MINKEDFLKIISIFKKDNPDPRTELFYTDDLSLLIAIILSARNQDKTVNKATFALFETHKTLDDFIELKEEGLKNYIRTIGLYNSKAKNIINSCKIIKEFYNSKIPDNFDELIKLPGVGRKTANVFLSIAKKQNTIGIDTHIERLSNRIGLVDTKKHTLIEEKLKSFTPLKDIRNIHHWLILHGRYVCKSRKPKCKECYISKICQYKHKSF